MCECVCARLIQTAVKAATERGREAKREDGGWGVGGVSRQMLDRAAGEADCSRQEEEDEKDKSGIYFVGAHLQI